MIAPCISKTACTKLRSGAKKSVMFSGGQKFERLGKSGREPVFRNTRRLR